MKNKMRTLLSWMVVFGFLLGLAACGPESQSSNEIQTNVEPSTPTGGNQLAGLEEGSGTRIVPPSEKAEYAEGSTSDNEGHPVIEQGESKVTREVMVPQDVEGKWKAVKIMVRHKADEEKSKMQMVSLGETFDIEESSLKVSVGPFLPNFVMSQTAYTSNGNELVNPAVRLVVTEGDQTIFEGWAFAKYPSMYAFEHETWSLQLMDFIPVSTS